MSILYLTSVIMFKSELEIVEMGEILSKYLFNEIPFDGLEKNIYDEVPAIQLVHEVLGFNIILSGYSSNVEAGTYNLGFYPNIEFEENEDSEFVDYPIDNYIFPLFKNKVPQEYYEFLR